MLGGGGELWLLVSPMIVRVNSEHDYYHPGSMQPFCFSLSIQYSINHMRYSTLYYNTGFILDSFAQL